MDHQTYMNKPSPVGSPAWQLEKKGEKRGEARGEKRGEARGKAEKARSIALNMLNAGMEVVTIAQLTGLSVKEVKALQSKNS